MGWMLSLLGSITGGFTAWAEHMPALKLHLILPHGPLPGYDLTGAASLVALVAVVLIWLGLRRLGAVLVLTGAVGGLFGADQLWTTAACMLFAGAVLTLFASPVAPPGGKKGEPRPTRG